MKKWLLGLVALVLAVALWMLSQWTVSSEATDTPNEGQVATESNTDLLPLDRLSELDAEEKTRTVLNEAPEGRNSEEGRARDTGELRFLSEKQFRQRLLDLGGGDPGRIFDRIHQQQPDKGNIWVLVTEGDKNAVDKAQVFLDPPQGDRPVQRVNKGMGKHSKGVLKGRTSLDGLAVFYNVAPRAYMLTVEHEDYLDAHQAQVESTAGEKTYVEVILNKAQERIEGLVVDENAVPLWGATVTSWRYNEGGVGFGQSVDTGFDGKFSLGVIPDSQSSIVAEKLGYKDARMEHVAAGTKSLTLRLERSETVWVSGFVTRGATSEAIPQFTVDSDSIHDEGGRFRVERNVKPEAQTLVFAAEGYEARPMVVTLDTNTDVDIGQVSLFGDGELSGIVLLGQAEGEPTPVEGALVSVTAGESFSDSQVTGTDGLFSFRGIQASSAQLLASAAGAGQYQNEVALLEGDVTYVEVLLSQGEYSASGHVLEEGSDEPIEGALVQLSDRPDLSALTDEAGAYEIRGIPSQQFSLTASHSGYNDEVSPTLTADESGATWDAHLDPSGLRFQFQANGANAPAGVPVVLWKRIQPTLAAAQAAQQSLATHRFEGLTGDDGRVTFDVEDGEYFVQVPSYRLDPTLVTASSSNTDWHVMALPGMTHLQGQILNSDGSPVSNTSLWLHSGDQDYSTMSLYYTDGAGNYSIENLAAKPYALSIIKSVADQSAQHVRRVTGSGSSAQTFNVSFPSLTSAVHGRLTDGNGAGVSGVWIGVEFLDAPHRSILAGWVGTDATGHFQVPRLEPGRHILRTAWGNFENVFSDEFTLAPGDDLEINLEAPQIPGKHIQGHILAADGGPLGPNFVYVIDGQGRQNGNFFSTMDWAYVGSFDVSGLAAGNHSLDATAMGCRKQQVPVSVSSSVTGVTISMQRE